MHARKKRNGTIVYREKIYINGKQIVSPWLQHRRDINNWKAKAILDKQKYLATGISYDLKITLREFANKWINERVKVRNSRKTQSAYKSNLDRHIFPLLERVPIGDMGYTHGNKLVANLKDKNLSNKTINGIVGVVKAMLNDAVKWNYIPKNGLFAFPDLKENPKTFKYWTKPEVAQFLRTTLRDELYSLWLVALNTGMRKGELLGLCWDRVDFANGQIAITRTYNRYGLQETTKTNEKRIIPINEQVKTVLLKLFKMQKDLRFVFTNADSVPLDYNHITREFKMAQKKAGMVEAIRFHDMRHTFASCLLYTSPSPRD